MKSSKFWMLSCALLCSNLYADSSNLYYDDEEESYFDEELNDEIPPKQKQRPRRQLTQSQDQQRQMLRTSNLNDGSMAGPVCCPPIVEDCCYCNVCPPTEMITPLGGPCVMDGQGVYITADFTYWTAREQGTSFATTSGFESFGSTEIPSTSTGKVIRPATKWRPGFKAGIGLDFCHDGWDVYAEYTWFRLNPGNTSKSVVTTDNPIASIGGPAGVSGVVLFDNFWGVNGAPQFVAAAIANTLATPSVSVVQSPTFQRVQGKWKLDFNVVDLELGRNFYISRRLTLRPHVGLKGEWQKQKLTVTFDRNLTTQGVITSTLQTKTMNNKFSNWGIGVRAGVDTAWHLARLFSIFGDVAITGLWEHFNAKRFDFLQFETTHQTSSNVHIKNDFFTFAPVFEWMLGLRFEWWTECNDFHFAFDAGWENQIWLFQNQFVRTYSTESDNSTLGLQGLTIKARLDF